VTPAVTTQTESPRSFVEDGVWEGGQFGRHEGRQAIHAFFLNLARDARAEGSKLTADLELVHKDSGEEVLLNRNQILNAEVYDGKTDTVSTFKRKSAKSVLLKATV
jgi:hypothetical protein